MSTTTNTASCPVCEQSFAKDSEAEAKNAVIGHMAASKGEHEGIGYQKAEQLVTIDATDGVEADGLDLPEAESEQSGEQGSKQSEKHSSEQSTNPAFGAPDTDPVERDDQDDDGTPCPHCGVEIEGYDDLDAGAYRCGACGDPFKVAP